MRPAMNATRWRSVAVCLSAVLAGAASSSLCGDAAAAAPRKIKIAAISLIWDEGYRTLENVLRALDEAGAAGADLACLPEECVYQPAEPIPGPAAQAIAGKAAQYKMNVVGNLREKDGDKTFVTSFLCDRGGAIVGKYRKSHRLPYEEDLSLGDELPVFATDLGTIGMKIGTDHFFPEIDTVLRRRGASLIVWSAAPFPVRDEHMETLALQGRAVDNNLSYAVARYAGKKDYGGYRDTFSWMGTWPLGRAQVLDNDGHTRADSGHAGGLALATLPAQTAQRKWTNEEDFRRPDAKVASSAGYPATGIYAAIAAEKPPAPFERKPDTKRVIKAAVVEAEGNIERLMAKLDTCGQAGCDIVCLWEFVWYNNDAEVEKYKERNQKNLARIANAAKKHHMYVMIAGELERGFNEAIIYDRDGKEFGRYTKINQTTDKKSKYYKAGDRVGIFDLDFGRICVKICADVYAPEIDRVAALHQADLMLLPTQDGGPFTEHTRLRDAHRCLDDGYFLLRAAGPTAQTDHRAYIMDPWGMTLAASQFQTDNQPLIATLQLDNRPKYYEWPPDVRKAGPYPDPYKRGLDEKALAEMYHGRPRPAAKGDLRAVLLSQRRSELYKQK